MPDNKFTLKDSDRMIKDIIDSFFQQENVTHDLEELEQVQLESPVQEIPPIEE